MAALLAVAMPRTVRKTCSTLPSNLTEAESAEVMNAIRDFRNPPILTIQLRSGRTVLAKVYECFTMAVTYANRTQAEKKVAQLGDNWEVFKGIGRPFYVAQKETL
jgi:hypothetical protein